jgi:hypothetical protein
MSHTVRRTRDRDPLTNVMSYVRAARGAGCFALLLCAASSSCSAAGTSAAPQSGGSTDWIAGAVAEDEWVDVADERGALGPSSTISGWPLGVAASAASPAALPAPTYALDGVSRFLRSDSGSACSSRGLLSYFGKEIPFGGVVVINPAFRERLERFEQAVSDVALATYGRRPLLIRHRGAFACRSRRGQPSLLSEHALGNAIDVSGFEFGAAAGLGSVPAGTPQTAFRVSVARHWQSAADSDVQQRHSRFLRSLIARLIARGDVFRGIITPADAAHADHFHFDMAPHSHLRL